METLSPFNVAAYLSQLFVYITKQAFRVPSPD